MRFRVLGKTRADADPILGLVLVVFVHLCILFTRSRITRTTIAHLNSKRRRSGRIHVSVVSVRLMTVPRHSRTAATGEKVQIGSFVSLHHVVEIELVVSALEHRLWRLPLG